MHILGISKPARSREPTPGICQFSVRLLSDVVIKWCSLALKIFIAAFVFALGNSSFCSLVLPG